MMNNLRFATALHILVLADKFKNEIITSDFIAGSINVNPVVVRREIKFLKEAGFIDSKKGKEGETKVNISSSVSFSEINKYPELQSIWREGTTAGNASSPFPRTLLPRVLSNNADNVPCGVSY